MSRMIQQHKRKEAAGTDPYVTDRDLDIEEVPTADVRVAGRKKRAYTPEKFRIVDNTTRQPVDDKQFDTYLRAERHWHSFENWEALDIEEVTAPPETRMASRRKRADAEGGAFQLPDDVVSKGSRQTGPFRHEQVFFSPSLNFEGTEREFVAAGHGYQFEQTDPHTRRVVNQRQMAGRKRANSKGKYVTLIQTPNNKLEIVPNPTTIAEFVDSNRDHLPTDVLTALEGFETPGERRYNVWGDDQTLYELMDDFLSNGWQNVDPEEISALTDAPIFEAPDGRIYWHERYQVESAAEELVLGKTVMFDGAPENKAPVAKAALPGDDAEDDNGKKESSVKAGAVNKKAEPNYTTRDAQIIPQRRREIDAFLKAVPPDAEYESYRDGLVYEFGISRGAACELTDQFLAGEPGSKMGKKLPAKTAFDDAPMDADPMPDDAMDDDTIDDDGAPPPDDSDIDAPMAPEPSAAPPAAPPASSNVFEKWQTQNLIDTIEALTASDTFASDKAEQKSVEQMAEILSARPVERNNEDVKQAAVKMAKTALSKVKPRYLGIEAAVKSAAGMDDFTQAYIEAALWSSHDESDESGGEPFDANYSAEDIAPDTLQEMIQDCAKFQADNAEHIQDENLLRQSKFSADGAAGHDFWLTRNGHGAGFWDVDWEEPAATALDAASEAFGEYDLELGDDGKIHGSGGYGSSNPLANGPSGPLAGPKQAWLKGKQAAQSDAPPQDGDTGKHLEGDTSIPRGADFDEDHTGIPDVPTTLPKEATVPTTGSALKTTESMIDKLKALYLEAKPIVGVNGTRPVREGVEAIYHAMHALGQTQKILSKQLKQEEDDEKVMADKEKAKQKGKASSLLSNLILAAAEI